VEPISTYGVMIVCAIQKKKGEIFSGVFFVMSQKKYFEETIMISTLSVLFLLSPLIFLFAFDHSSYSNIRSNM
jgi:hypothetical protein